MIRCRRCGERAPSELALCPHCGRELLPAPPRLVTWGVPSLLVVLFMAALVGQLDGRNPITWAQTRLSSAGTGAGETANRGIVVVMTPVPADEEEAGDDALAEAAQAEEPVAVADVAAVEEDQAGAQAPVVEAATETVALSVAEAAPEPEQPAEQPIEQPVEQPVESEAVQPVEQVPEQPAEPEVAETPEEQAAEGESVTLPTATPVPAATNTPLAAAIAAVTPEAAVAVVASAAAGKAATAGLPTATPTKQAPPTPTATEAPTEPPTLTPAPTYQIRRGDTLIVVARRHEVSLEDLMLANGIDAQDAFTIQPGQILVIPTEGYQPPATPTPEATATATTAPAVPPTATPALPTPLPTPALRLDAPALRSPEPGTPVSCSAPTSLVWLPVPFMRAEDKYVLHLGFVNGRTDEGQEIVIWVLEQPRPANLTSWDMDASLCSLAPQEYGRQWRWYVEAAEEIDGKLIPVSPTSEIWQFSWN